SVVLGIRPEDFEDAALDRDPSKGRIRTHVELRETLGRESNLYFHVLAPRALTDDTRELAVDADQSALGELEKEALERKTRFVARVGARTAAREGELIELTVDTAALHFFDPESGAALGT